jgi:hypothetical protein
LEPVATSAIGIVVFSGHIVIARLFVGVGQVLCVCDERFIPAEVQLVVFKAGRALKQTAASCGGDGQEDDRQGRERSEVWAGQESIHVPWFKVAHSVNSLGL